MQTDDSFFTCKYVSFSGGGTRGLLFIGAIDGIHQHLGDAWVQGLKGISGCSAGSMAALMLAVGLTKEQRHAVAQRYQLDEIIQTVNLNTFWNNYGFNDSSRLAVIVHDILTRAGLSKSVTFKDMKRLLRMQFVVVVTDLCTAREKILSFETTPDLTIVDAICASCCIPFLFKPYLIDNHACVDGCLSLNMPDDMFPEEETMSLCIKNSTMPASVPDNWTTFMYALMRSSIACQERYRDAKGTRPRHCIDIHCTQSPLDFSMTQEDRMDLLQRGFVCTMDYFHGGNIKEYVLSLVRRYMKCRCNMMDKFATDDDEHPPP